MTSYTVQRELTTWEEVIVEASSEEEALELAQEMVRTWVRNGAGDYEPTGYWNVLVAEPTKEITK